MKILYVDGCLLGPINGAHNRSVNLLKTLKNKFEVDVLLIRTSNNSNSSEISEFLNGLNTYFLKARKANALSLDPKCYFQFTLIQQEIFKRILRRGEYDRIMFRFQSCWNLVEICKDFVGEKNIIVDFDFYLSELTSKNFSYNPVLKNRYFLFETIKLRRREKEHERSKVKKIFSTSTWRDNEIQFKNIFDSQENNCDLDASLKKNSYLLFYGDLNSHVNMRAMQLIRYQILPRLSKSLLKNKLRFVIAGIASQEKMREIQELFRAYPVVAFRFNVDSMVPFIQNAKSVVLPVYNSVGALTRVTESLHHNSKVIAPYSRFAELKITNHPGMALNLKEVIEKTIASIIQKNDGVNLELKAKLKYEIKKQKDLLLDFVGGNNDYFSCGT
jgi:hypothetical protein